LAAGGKAKYSERNGGKVPQLNLLITLLM